MVKREAKVMLYDLMARIYNTVLPYGSLTGVRPTKLYREVSGAGGDAYKYFTEYLRVRRDKAELVKSVCAAQEGLISGDKRDMDLFVNVPFCTTRCSYCSFISAEIGRVKKIYPRLRGTACEGDRGRSPSYSGIRLFAARRLRGRRHAHFAG